MRIFKGVTMSGHKELILYDNNIKKGGRPGDRGPLD